MQSKKEFNKSSIIKKPKRSYKAYSGEYFGTSFDLTRRKLNKQEVERHKKLYGKRPRYVVEYRYNDSDVTRSLSKKQYKNLVKNSEILYDEMKGKYIRHSI